MFQCKGGGKFFEENSRAQMDLKDNSIILDSLDGRARFFPLLFPITAFSRFSHNNTTWNSYGRINNDKFSKCFYQVLICTIYRFDPALLYLQASLLFGEGRVLSAALHRFPRVICPVVYQHCAKTRKERRLKTRYVVN